jgi:hypothetical protein
MKKKHVSCEVRINVLNIIPKKLMLEIVKKNHLRSSANYAI